MRGLLELNWAQSCSGEQRVSHFRLTFLYAALALTFSFIFMAGGTAQTRLSDKDLEQRIKNLNSDGKKFQSDFNDAISKSSILKTSLEKDARTWRIILRSPRNLSTATSRRRGNQLLIFKTLSTPLGSLKNCNLPFCRLDHQLQRGGSHPIE
jgi:hypothetical protein